MDANETTLFNAFLILVMVIGSIVLYFIISLIGHQRRNQKLHKSNILAEITTLEKERRRVAADLHDELGPILASVKFKIGALDIHSREDSTTVDKINSNIDELITRMREISNDLLPNTLMRKGLAAAMEESVSNFNQAKKLRIQLEYRQLPLLSQEKAVNIFRILQEVIHNTIKHSGASHLLIVICGRDNLVQIVTQDDGRGFNHRAAAKESRGLGLRNMLSRMEIMNGNMYIESAPGKGTRHTFEIPI